MTVINGEGLLMDMSSVPDSPSMISRQHLERLLRLVDQYAGEGFIDAERLMLDIYRHHGEPLGEGCLDKLVAKLCG